MFCFDYFHFLWFDLFMSKRLQIWRRGGRGRGSKSRQSPLRCMQQRNAGKKRAALIGSKPTHTSGGRWWRKRSRLEDVLHPCLPEREASISWWVGPGGVGRWGRAGRCTITVHTIVERASEVGEYDRSFDNIFFWISVSDDWANSYRLGLSGPNALG